MILSWKAPIYYSDNLIGSYDIQSGSYDAAGSNFDYLSLLTGEPYPAGMDKPKVFFPCKKMKLLAYDCLWLLGDVPLVSERLANFLIQYAAHHIEFMTPTSITAAGEEVGDAYYIINAAQAVSAVDHGRSIAERSEKGSILYFNEIWFHESAQGMNAIARECESGDLLISQVLADAMIEQKFRSNKGLGFYTADRSFKPYKNQA